MNAKLDSSHAVRTDTRNRFSRALLVLALVLVSLAEARAQQPSDQPPLPPPPPPPATLLSGIEVLPTTYLWFPWTAVGVRPANTRFSNASTTIGPGDLYGHLTWVPFMGQAEFRNDQFGVITDFIHAPLKSGVTTGEVLFGGGTTNFTINTGSAVFLYRALELPSQNADVGLGFRAWGLDGAITLDPLRQRVSPISVAN